MDPGINIENIETFIATVCQYNTVICLQNVYKINFYF